MMEAPEGAEQLSVPDLRQQLAAAFVRVMGDNPLHAKALGVLVARINVVFGQLDYLRQLATTPDLPAWHVTSGAWLVSDRIGAEVGTLALALRDALEADTSRRNIQAAVH